MSDAEEAAARFNEMINARDIGGLADLMSDDHTFIDTAGHVVVGKAACLAAWRGFFAAYPTYRNVFELMRTVGDVVAIVGRSVCANERDLDGPAIWTAVTDGKLSQWRVLDDTPEARRRLGIEQQP